MRVLNEGDRVRYAESFCAETSTTEAGRKDCASRRGVVAQVFEDGELCLVDWGDHFVQSPRNSPVLVRVEVGE